MPEQALPVERFAELRAEMEAGALRDDVLARAGLTPEAWIAAQKAFLAQMGAEIERGRFELTSKYTAAFLARQTALAVPAQTPPAPAASPAALPAAPAPPAAARAASHQAPSFLLAGAAPREPPVAPAPTAAAAPVAAPALPRVVRSPLQATSLHVDRPAGAATPFEAGAPGSPPRTGSGREPARPAAGTGRRDLGGTAMALDGGGKAATPFEPGKVEVSGVTLKQYAALGAAIELAPARTTEILASQALTPESKARLDAHWQERFSRDGLATLEYMRLIAQEKAAIKARAAASPSAPAGPTAPPEPRAGSPLPFAAPAPGATPGVLAAAQRSPAEKRSPVGSGTGYIPEEMVKKAATPFQAATPAAAPAPAPSVSAAPARTAVAPDLTLQQYASLCAELAVYPDRADAIRAKYRIADAAAQAGLDRAWHERFAREPAARAQCESLVREYRGWLAGQR